MENIEINKNISLHYIPMPDKKTTSAGVYIHRPLCAQEVSKNALLPYVLKRGCRLCPDSESVAKYLENLYGASFGASVMKIGDDQIIYLGFETISDKYAPEGERLCEDITALMMSVLFEPSQFTEETLSQEKKNGIDRILAEINEKAVYARNRCTQEMFAADSFALSPLGTKEGVAAVDAEDLRAHYNNIITASPVDIYICGDTDIAAIGERIRAFAKRLEFHEAFIPASSQFNSNGAVKRVTERMDVVQGKLCIGFKTGIGALSDDFVPLMIMDSIYGGGAHSKLFNNVREKLSLCYYASSSLVKNKGIMYVNAGIEFKNFEKAYNEIIAQLEAVKQGDISDAEFSSSVIALTNRLESYKDDPWMIQLFYVSQKVSGTNLTIDDLKEKISRVTVGDVKRVSQGVEPDTVYFLTGEEE